MFFSRRRNDSCTRVNEETFRKIVFLQATFVSPFPFDSRVLNPAFLDPDNTPTLTKTYQEACHYAAVRPWFVFGSFATLFFFFLFNTYVVWGSMKRALKFSEICVLKYGPVGCENWRTVRLLRWVRKSLMPRGKVGAIVDAGGTKQGEKGPKGPKRGKSPAGTSETTGTSGKSPASSADRKDEGAVRKRK